MRERGATAPASDAMPSLELLSEACCRIFTAVLLSSLKNNKAVKESTADAIAMGLLAALCAAGGLTTSLLENHTVAANRDASTGGTTGEQTWSSACASSLKSGRSTLVLLCTSATVCLLQPFNWLKGLNEVYLADHLNAEVTKPMLGSDMVGYELLNLGHKNLEMCAGSERL
eukprot:888423-Prymnesium_polylepis.2